jgi:hypothetical protein
MSNPIETMNPDEAREFEILLGAFMGLENNVEAYAGESVDEKMRATIESLVGGRMNPDEAHAFLAQLQGRPGVVGQLAKRLKETREAVAANSKGVDSR